MVIGREAEFFRGQSLVELVIGIAIAAILAGSVVAALLLSVRVNKESINTRAASVLAQELLDNTRSLGEGDWTSIYNQSNKSASSTYYIDFGLASSGVTSTLTRSISSGENDYSHFSDGGWISTQLQTKFGDDSSGLATVHSGLRFLNVSIPRGAIIDSATMRLRTSSISVGSGIILTKISLVDADNPSAATSDATCDAHDAIRTSAQTDWDFTLTDSDNVELVTPDFSASVQEVVDRSGWASGNAMLVHIDDDGNTDNEFQSVASYEGAYTEATIDIIYTPPACNDGIDNDEDGYTDHPSDIGCSGADDRDETDSGAIGSLLEIATGTETVIIDGVTFTRWISIENVNRDSSWDIVESSGTEDTSTQKIVAYVTWQEGGGTASIDITEYITRWPRNESTTFTDWSGSSGSNGPIVRPDSNFSTTTGNMSTSTQGQLKLN